MPQSSETVIATYLDKIEILLVEAKLKESISSRYSMIRLGLLLAIIGWVYFMNGQGAVEITIGILVIVVAFLFIVSKQSDIEEAIKTTKNKLQIVQNEIDCINQVKSCYDHGEEFEDGHHYYSGDLDIFGDNSLYSWINRARTFNGLTILAKWFATQPKEEEINNRTESIQELETLLEWRLDFQASLFELENGLKTDIVGWLKKELDIDFGFCKNRLISLYLSIVPFLWVGLGVLYALNINGISSLAGILFLINLMLVGRNVKQVNSIQNSLSLVSRKLSLIENAVSHILSKEWSSDQLRSYVTKHQSKEKNNANSIYKLNQIISILDYRLNLLVGVTLNGLILWDLRCVRKLSLWKEEEEENLSDLVEIVGVVEALSSLACWAYNHPNYSYPVISSSEFGVIAKSIKHPLIPEELNVANDFSINKGDYISIITGSNMAGKSTFLRTIGINMVLAYTGSKVAATIFECPLVKLVTYMRIKDVLEDNVSTFKAELNRIKLILDLISQDEKCLILIDEMLRGTNSKDKLQGSISITKKLLENKAYTLIATHDIKLAELAHEVNEGIKNYYFDIDYANDELVFDYKIKLGICQNFNASFLLKQLGIG